jgi:hypothetical protein
MAGALGHLANLLLPAVMLAACSANDATLGERQELANLPAALWVPSVQPATLVRSFIDFCVDTPSDAAARTAMLRRAGYVPAGGWTRGIRRFVSAGPRPMVVLSESGRACAVRARARAGQEAAISREFAKRWPGARKESRNGGLDSYWQTGAPEAPLVAVLRNAAGAGQNEITLALVRN